MFSCGFGSVYTFLCKAEWPEYLYALTVVLKLFCFKIVKKLITHNTYNTYV